MTACWRLKAYQKLHPTQIRVEQMKLKYFLISTLLLLCLSSCTSTYNVISKAAMDKAIDHVAIELKSKGYYPAGTSTDTKNEVTVTGQSYSKYSGYGTLMGNNYITSDTYRFADTLGNSMDYTVSYQLKNSDGFYYVTDLQVKGCETSNVREYGNLCGPTSPTKTITNLSPDSSVSLFDANKTYILIGVLALIGCIPVYAIIM
jgi:hypothetical protein